MVPARPPGPLGAPPMPPVRPPRCPVPRRRPRRRWLGTAGSRSSHPGTEALARPPARSAPAAPRCTPASPWRRCAPAAVPRPPPRARASHRPRRAPAAGLRPTRPPGFKARDLDAATPAWRGRPRVKCAAAASHWVNPRGAAPLPRARPVGPRACWRGRGYAAPRQGFPGRRLLGFRGPPAEFRRSELMAHLGEAPPPGGGDPGARRRSPLRHQSSRFAGSA